jgi:UV DNA damage repair endonuclease
MVECDESINSEPMKHDNGNFTMTISEQDAISIDKCESSILRTAYPDFRTLKKTCQYSMGYGYSHYRHPSSFV